MASTKQKTAKRTVHAEADDMQIVRQNDKWFIARPGMDDQEVSVEEAARQLQQRPAALVTHHQGLRGGKKFDDAMLGTQT